MRDLAKLINEDLKWYLDDAPYLQLDLQHIAKQWTYGAPEVRPLLWAQAQTLIWNYLGDFSWTANDTLFLLQWRSE